MRAHIDVDQRVKFFRSKLDAAMIPHQSCLGPLGHLAGALKTIDAGDAAGAPPKAYEMPAPTPQF